MLLILSVKTNTCLDCLSSVISPSSTACDTIFNLSHRVLSDAEIKLLEKELEFAPIQTKINELELREDFEEGCHHMRVKWHQNHQLGMTHQNLLVRSQSYPLNAVGNLLSVTLILK